MTHRAVLSASVLSLSMFGFASASQADAPTKAWAVAHDGVTMNQLTHAAKELTGAIRSIKVSPDVMVSSAQIKTAAKAAKFSSAGTTALFEMRSRAMLRDSTNDPGTKPSMLFAVQDLMSTMKLKADGKAKLDTATLRTLSSSSQVGLVNFADPVKPAAK